MPAKTVAAVATEATTDPDIMAVALPNEEVLNIAAITLRVATAIAAIFATQVAC